MHADDESSGRRERRAASEPPARGSEERTRPLHVVHLITALQSGGAQTMLANLLATRDGRRYEEEVIALVDLSGPGEPIRATGARVRSLGMDPARPRPRDLRKLSRWLRESRPDILHTWMYHANLIGSLTARGPEKPRIVWNIRRADLVGSKRVTRWIARAGALLSRRSPTRIVCCSEAAWKGHRDLGYDTDRMVVIPNGVDSSRWKPDREARLAIRTELGISEDTPLVGLVGRFHEVKGHRDFVAAAAKLRCDVPGIRFLLCGTDIVWENASLESWITEAGLRDACFLLGERSDVSRIDAALDVAVSASLTEGFPNAIAEAMACGVPCVVTDVGESAALVGSAGSVVSPADPEALQGAVRDLLRRPVLERQALGRAARDRILDVFELDRIAARYHRLYDEVSACGEGTHGGI